MSTKTDLVALLEKPGDFESWDRAFRTQVENFELREEIFNKRPLLVKPVWPVQPEPPKRPNITIKRGAQTRSQAEIAAELAAAQAAGTDPNRQTPAPEPSTSTGNEPSTTGNPNLPVEVPQNEYDMLMKEYEAIKGDWGVQMSIYNTNCKHFDAISKEYNDQKSKLIKLREWIEKTVSNAYMETCCKPSEPLPTWYTNLQTSAKKDTRKIEDELSEELEDLTKCSGKAPKWMEWTADWEKVISRMDSRGMVELKSSRIWYRLTSRKLKWHDETRPWIAPYEIMNVDKIDAGTLNYRTFLSDLRAWVVSNPPKASKTPGKPIVRGSFPTTLGDNDGDNQATDEEQEVKEQATTKQPRKTKPKGSGASKSKRKYGDRGSVSTVNCRSCEKPGHTFENCWYTFPEKAPANYPLTEEGKRNATKNLAADSSLREEVEKLRSAKTRKE